MTFFGVPHCEGAFEFLLPMEYLADEESLGVIFS